MHFLPHSIKNNHFLLTAGRTVFWEEEKVLILSDLHVGKSGHFRKHGIGVPQSILLDDLRRMAHQVQYFKPGRLIIVGDLFHSHDNAEHGLFMKWKEELPAKEMHLILGNHDILHDSVYGSAGIRVHEEVMEAGDFAFVHDIHTVQKRPDKYFFCGHVHPGISVSGRGRQSLHFPCFHFTPGHATLPAFGTFTGTYPIRPEAEDSVFAVVNNTVICLV